MALQGFKKREGNVSEHSEIPRSLSRTLRKIESRPGVHKPRALILASDATPLLDWGDTTLPVAVGGLTKLFTMAMVLRELDRGALTLETRIGDVLPEEAMSGLCVLGGIDHSSSITIAHLLSHRSGITDYFTPPGKNTLSLLQQVTRQDRAWSLDQALEISRHYSGRFIPSADRAPEYSATNYLLLGAILTETTGMSFPALVNLRIVGPLNLTGTYAFSHDSYEKYFSISPIYQATEVLRAPQALASSAAHGSMISTAYDVATFVSALWAGKLCEPTWLGVSADEDAKTRRAGLASLGLTVAKGTPPLVGMGSDNGAATALNLDTGAIGFATSNQLTTARGSFDDLAAIMNGVLA